MKENINNLLLDINGMAYSDLLSIAKREKIIINTYGNNYDLSEIDDNLYQELLSKIVDNNFYILKDIDVTNFNKEFIFKLVESNINSLPYFKAIDGLNNDKDFLLKLVNLHVQKKSFQFNTFTAPIVVEFASNELKSDKNFILEAIKSNGNSLLYSSKEFKKDKELILEAVKTSGNVLVELGKIDESLFKDKELILEAIKSDINSKNNKYEKSNKVILNYIPDELRKDANFIKDLFNVVENDRELRFQPFYDIVDKSLYLDPENLLFLAKGTDVLEILPKKIQTDELIEFLVDISPYHYVKYSKLEESQLNYFKSEPNNYFLLNKDFFSNENFLLKAIKINPIIVEKIPKNMLFSENIANEIKSFSNEKINELKIKLDEADKVYRLNVNDFDAKQNLFNIEDEIKNFEKLNKIIKIEKLLLKDEEMSKEINFRS